MKIIFNDNHPAQLPEISAYIDFARAQGWKAERLSEVSSRSDNLVADVYWTFMGVERKPKIKAKIYVQDYCSGSVGYGKSLKNKIKKLLNFKPDIRIYLNPYVRSLFQFTDKVPYFYRDMGISDFFFKSHSFNRHGFICVTNLSTQAELIKILKSFNDCKRSLTVVGPVDQEVQSLFAQSEIVFLGRVNPRELSEQLGRHEFGIVLYKNVEPYSGQTSTRILEYCASGLKVISTPTEWVNNFFANNAFYSLTGKIDFEAIDRFKFSNPDVSGRAWECEIQVSGVFDFLKKKLNSMQE